MRHSGLLFFMLLPLLVLMGCAGTSPQTAQQFARQYGIENPRPEQFIHCFGHGCRQSMLVQLEPAEWAKVRQLFDPPSHNAAEERQRMIAAIALLEQMVGRQAGTEKDIGGSFPGVFLTDQLDCIDEAINTGTYLTLMAEAKLIRFHQVMAPAIRGYVIFGWPHFATVLVEEQTQARYVIDSWFLDNGQPPFVLPLAVWKEGWEPES